MHENEMQWRDEILEVMYWMRGEHLSQHVTRAELSRFLNLEGSQLDRALARLVAAKLVTAQSAGHSEGETFELTTQGIEEGRRRFQEEFSTVLGRPSHLTCDDPSCDCNADDWNGVCPHTAGSA